MHERYGADQAQTLLAGYTRQRDNLLARIVGVLDADVRVLENSPQRQVPCR